MSIQAVTKALDDFYYRSAHEPVRIRVGNPEAAARDEVVITYDQWYGLLVYWCEIVESNFDRTGRHAPRIERLASATGFRFKGIPVEPQRAITAGVS